MVVQCSGEVTRDACIGRDMMYGMVMQVLDGSEKQNRGKWRERK
jgi:hypothetical protein